MNPFKIGDKVRCTRDISSSEGGPRAGEIFMVTSVDSSSIGFHLTRLRDYYSANTRSGKHPNWGWTEFELLSSVDDKLNLPDWF